MFHVNGLFRKEIQKNEGKAYMTKINALEFFALKVIKSLIFGLYMFSADQLHFYANFCILYFTVVS